ncbi:MAG: response regulator transcription factor [Desulfobacterales bacterium]
MTLETILNTPHPEKVRVLVVDDHPVMRECLCGMIELHSDIAVIGEASDGEEAVKLARQLIPEVILMDINMPKVSGIEATRVIHTELPHIRIIALSMSESDEFALEMIAAGASEYHSKGGDMNRLLQAIRRKPDRVPCRCAPVDPIDLSSTV